MSSEYIQDYFLYEILSRVQNWRLGVQVQCPDVRLFLLVIIVVLRHDMLSSWDGETWDKNWCGNRSCAHGTPPTISLRGSFAAKFRHFELNTSQRDLYRPTCTFGTARQTGGRCSHRRTEPVRYHHTKQMMLRVWSCLLRNSLTKETFWLVS